MGAPVFPVVRGVPPEATELSGTLLRISWRCVCECVCASRARFCVCVRVCVCAGITHRFFPSYTDYFPKPFLQTLLLFANASPSIPDYYSVLGARRQA